MESKSDKTRGQFEISLKKDNHFYYLNTARIISLDFHFENGVR